MSLPYVVDTSRSMAARLRPLPVDAIKLTDDFWAPRLRTNRETTLPTQYRLLHKKGRLDNFLRAAGKKDIPFQGYYYFNDTDVYKWLEAAAWALAVGPEDPELIAMIDEAITLVADAQGPDGYLDTYFSVDRAGQRWTNFDLHEMYCAGHLFQAAVAHHRATGSRRLLDVATRFADHLCAMFGPEEQGKRNRLDAHPEVEMALVELYRVTGERRYLEQAQFFLDARGHGLLGRPYGKFEPDYAQDGVPFRELQSVVGHAVRMMYLDCGAADIYAETGETALLAAMTRQWANMTERKLYITGGAGAKGEGEAFDRDHQLPNGSAYAETCAAIGSFMWNWRMLLLTGEARYADLMELTLYNGLLSGISLDGTRYFYENPLANDGTHRRQEWFECACCPPNVARTLAALPGYHASVAADALWLHLYGSSRGTVTLPDGATIAWTQTANYPWHGNIEITIDSVPATPIALHLRVPGWAEGATLTLNGTAVPRTLIPGSYESVTRVWQPGDTLHLELPMPIQQRVAHPNLVENRACMALMRGPLVYCIEQADHPEDDLLTLRLPAVLAAQLEPVERPNLLGGITTLEGSARSVDLSAWNHALYKPLTGSDALPERAARLTAIPYYTWANRAPGPMMVWIPMS
jgi:uncharacterized protein